MDQSHKLLMSVASAAGMGKDSVNMLLNKTEDERMQRQMRRLSEQYELSREEAESRLRETGGKPRPQNPVAKAGAWMGIQMDTLTDRSNSHLADMLIQGVTMGIVEVTRASAANPEADGEARRIAGAFLENEQQSIETLKEFL